MKRNILLLIFPFCFVTCSEFNSTSEDTNEPVGKTVNGKKEGEWKTYYVNGEIAIIENYHNDILNGVYLCFNNKGSIRGRAFYKNGIMVDSSIGYFSDGNINFEHWSDSTGKTQGRFKVYHENGQLSQVGYKKDGFLDDTCKIFYENGQLKAIEIYRNNKKDGAWRYFSNSGTQTKTEFYKNDNLVSSKE